MCFTQTSFTYRHLCYMAKYNYKQNQDEEVEHTHVSLFLRRRKEIQFFLELEPTV